MGGVEEAVHCTGGGGRREKEAVREGDREGRRCRDRRRDGKGERQSKRERHKKSSICSYVLQQPRVKMTWKRLVYTI